MMYKIENYSLIKDGARHHLRSTDKVGLARAKESKRKIMEQQNLNKQLVEKLNSVCETVEYLKTLIERDKRC